VLLPPAEALALVEEVERLRAYVGDLKRHGASLHKAAGAGRDAERAAVVAWLRRVATDARDWSERADVYDAIADDIESGEHRREEDGK
jgi:hypothetical protein